jgi:hypothetical protein
VKDALDQGMVSRKKLAQAAKKASAERLCDAIDQRLDGHS